MMDKAKPTALVFLLLAAASNPSVRDPGVRGGAAGAGSPLPGLTPYEAQFGRDAFIEADSVQGAVAGEPGIGLGPRYNGNSCTMCHQQPAVGGTSPFVNPIVAVATLDGARNVVPWFITANGPIREARFKVYPDGSPDGGVHNLFTITGRIDADGCVMTQPSFGTPGDPVTGQGGDGNVVFRIPSPMFGAGLIEQIPDSTLYANMQASPALKRRLGISGHPNVSGNDGTYTRFGWKAQNKSSQMFAAEAYNVEMGVTDEMFQTERYDSDPGCLYNALPEDRTDLTAQTSTAGLSDVLLFTFFSEFLAPPTPAPDSPSIVNGRQQFSAVGCALCHTPSLTTGAAASAALSGKTAFLYSDLLVHSMGTGLADGITQGTAGPDEFRTAPLWGAGQRIFFLHDGRTTDLLQAIQAHASAGSEANAVVRQFNALKPKDQQDVLTFLRSL